MSDFSRTRCSACALQHTRKLTVSPSLHDVHGLMHVSWWRNRLEMSLSWVVWRARALASTCSDVLLGAWCDWHSLLLPAVYPVHGPLISFICYRSSLLVHGAGWALVWATMDSQTPPRRCWTQTWEQLSEKYPADLLRGQQRAYGHCL